tara:strand:+ start:152 stop:1396 length:1245 start_codon:yes stop_codon:yes gene_type:complete
MKKLLLILLSLPLFGFGQQTYVPDDNFEQELINLGYDSILDDSVLTANINMVTQLFLSNRNIIDLTGIEDFVDLQTLDCNFNPGLINLDLSNNTELISLSSNQIWGTQSGSLNYINVSNCNNLRFLTLLHSQVSNIDLSDCSLLLNLNIGHNFLTSIDISNNDSLQYLIVDNNLIASIDISNLPDLKMIDISDNPYLECADLRNGHNINLSTSDFYSTATPLLDCMSVDDSVYSINNWTNISSNNSFSENNCPLVCSSINCSDSLFVTNVLINNNDSTIRIGIYNGYNNFLSYPYVSYTLDANGDTLHTGFLNSFGTLSNDTSWYIYDLFLYSTAVTPLSIHFVYTISSSPFYTGTCVLQYDSISTNINQELLSENRKLVDIIDISGRKIKFRYNQPLFYIYNDGTVEKRIIIE